MSALDTKRICRLCCTMKGQLRPLFEQGTKLGQKYPLPLSELIYVIVDLKVDPNDGLPQQICGMCVGNLLKMYKDIQSYRENDLLMRKQLNQAKVDDIEDRVEVEEISIKQEVVENESQSELESQQRNNVEEKEDTAADEKKTPAELEICVNNEPLDEHDEGCPLEVTDTKLVAKNKQRRKRRRRDWKCAQCEENLPSKASLVQHVKLVHSVSTTMSCAICGEVFDTEYKLRIHRKSKHSRKQFDCQICQKKYYSLQTLEDHLKTIHLNKKLKCSYCPKEHSTEGAKRCHEHRHTRNPNLKTRQTWTQYFTPVEDQEDSKRRKGKCNICGNIARNISAHIQELHFPVDLNCDICGKNFKRRRVLLRHKRKLHSVQSSALNGEQSNADKPKQVKEEIEADAEVDGLADEDLEAK